MAAGSEKQKIKLVKGLQKEVSKLQSELAKANELLNALTVRVVKNESRYSEAYDTDRSDKLGLAKYVFHIDITAGRETVYIPTSIASGRKSTGFIYQIEGTAESTAIANVTFQGNETMIVTSGTLSYCKIPPGKTARFKIIAEVTGTLGKSYRFVISRINFKHNPNDMRYKRFLTEIASTVTRFR